MIKYLDDLLEYVQPQPYIVSSTDYNGGDIPVLTANQSFILGYTDEKNGIFYASEKCPVIIFDDFTCDIKFVDFPFKVKSSALKILRSRTDPSTLKFVYEMMKLTIPLSNNHKRHWISETSHLAYAMPSTNDQVSISKLSTLIDKIMQSQRQEICLLRQILSTIYNYWFVQFDFPDKNDRPYKSSGGKMVYNDQLKQKIPEGWTVATLADVFSIKQPEQLSKADMSSSPGKHRVYGSNGIIGSYSKYNYIDSVIAVSCRGNCGNVYRTMPKSWVTSNAMVVTPLSKTVTMHNAYIMALLESLNLKSATTGSIQGQITWTNLSKIKIVIPKMNALDAFNRIADPMYELQIILEDEVTKLASLRDWLLPMLMNGQVKIKNDQ